MGYIKDRVFATPIADIDELKSKIQAAACFVTRHSKEYIEYHLHILQAIKGHILKFTEVNGLKMLYVYKQYLQYSQTNMSNYNRLSRLNIYKQGRTSGSPYNNH